MSSASAKKGGVLVLQAVTNLTYGILMAECRKPSSSKKPFFGPSAVLMFELMKFAVSLCGLAYEQYCIVVYDGTAKEEYKQSPSAYMRLAQSPTMNNRLHLQGDDDDNDDLSYDATLTEDTPYSHVVRTDKEKEVSASPENASAAILERQESVYEQTRRLVCKEIFSLGAFRMCIPAVLYVIQNNVFIFSAGYLSATEFQVFSQTKLIFTAILSVLILGKELNIQHWSAICLLICGIVGAQLSAAPRIAPIALKAMPTDAAVPVKTRAVETLSAMLSSSQWRPFIGMSTILVACFISGLAAVLLEKLYKGKRSFWTLNLHLSFFSLVPAVVPIFADTLQHHTFDPLRNYTALVWLLVVVNAAGGFVVALVLRYADNILKGFAVSAALIATMLISAFVTQETVFSFLELAGMIAIVVSMFLYGRA